MKGSNSDRFILRLNETNGLVTAETGNLNFWSYNNRLTADGNGLQTLEIYNTLGQVVYSSRLSGDSYSTELELAGGSYIGKVVSA